MSVQHTEAPLGVEDLEDETVERDDRPWVVIVWNDPINLMSYGRTASSVSTVTTRRSRSGRR